MIPIIAKLLMTVAGLILMAFGVVLAPLPGPMGVPFVLFGLVLLLRSSVWIKRRFVDLMHAHPKWVRPLRNMLRPGAKVISLMWLQGLRVERGVMPKRFRFMHGSRQRVRSVFRNRRTKSAM